MIDQEVKSLVKNIRENKPNSLAVLHQHIQKTIAKSFCVDCRKITDPANYKNQLDADEYYISESVMSVSRITLEKNKMTYIYDHSKGTIISDEKPELKDKKTRKPGAVPPKHKPINTILVDQLNQEKKLCLNAWSVCYISMKTDQNRLTMTIQIL